MELIPIRLSVTTCYLIKTGDSYVLVDTGYAEDWELFVKKLGAHGVKLSQLSHIILTHHHDDHCGLLHDILGQNPSVRVIMSEPCVRLIAVGENDRTYGGGLLNRRVAFLLHRKQVYLSFVLGKEIDRKNNLRFRPYTLRQNDIVVRDGTSLREIGIPLDGKFLATPGHTADSISLLFPDGDCLVGDAAADMLRFAGTKHCVVFVGNLDEYYKSWRKLLAAGAKRILPAHGKPFPSSELARDMGKNHARSIVR